MRRNNNNNNNGDDAGWLLQTESRDKWRRLSTRRRAGILAPLFYIYSADSVGIGDLSDLKLLIDWCAKTGNSIVQLLPMNEVGPVSCPYDSISSFALEPAYISLADMEGSGGKAVKDAISKARKEYPAGAGYVNYAVKQAKVKILCDIYAGSSDLENKGFRKFIHDNSYWIEDFALFKALKKHHDGKPWYEWEDEYKDRDPEELRKFTKQWAGEILFEKWVQWHLYTQFGGVKEYAASKQVAIKGDLPILVSRDSVDVWAHSDYFKLEYSAGAPPDLYCAKGQRWGMPTNSWEVISDDGYRYIKEKLKYAGNFYDMLRIDHVVGLFRIWSIPYNDPSENHGLNGSFDPGEEGVWEERGRRLLSIMLDSTNMLLCAEDLGIVPDCCKKVMGELGIPGNDVQRWVKDWNNRHDFLEPNEYRQVAVSVLSTHDTTNWAAWWENEAGTIDEELFIRKCREKGVDFGEVKRRLFSSSGSRRGRLRWSDKVASQDVFASLMGRSKDEMWDLIDMYENTFKEKEKLWRHLRLKGPVREKSDTEIITAVFKIALESRSIFSIQLLTDLLFLTEKLSGDPYRYRINTPGTVDPKNWSLTAPVSIEEMLKTLAAKDIRAMIAASGRTVD